MPGTRLLSYRDLREQVEQLGTEKTTEYLTELLEKKEIQPRDFSIRELAEAYMSREWVDNLHPKRGRFVGKRELLEADGSAVAFSDFSNITGQIFFNKVKDAYENEEFVFSKTVPGIQTDILDMELIPSITVPSDEFTVIPEGGEYPFVGVGEDFQHRAALQKRGDIIPVTKEAIFSDRTGKLLDHAGRLGDALGINKEKRICDMVLDENAGAIAATIGGHRYYWKNTSYATYQATTPWINLVTSNGLVTYLQVEQAWLRLVQITDPYTGEPIRIRPRHLVVQPTNYMTALRIKRTVNVQTHAGGYAVTGNLADMHAPSPLNEVMGDLQILQSQQLSARSARDTDWWLGDLTKAFAYYYAWDITPDEAPPNSREAFHRDVVFQHKVSEMGTAVTMDPRFIIESRA